MRTPTKLTDLSVKATKPETKRREIPDGSIMGLFLIVQTSDVKSWALRYRAGGRARKLTLGRYPAVDLAMARKLAKVALGQIALGRDPGAEKIAERKAAAKGPDDLNKATPFGIVRDEYLRLHISKKRRSTQRQAESLLKREFARWDKRPIGEITRGDIHRVLDAIVDRGHGATANRAQAYLKMMLSWAIERGIIDSSPADRMRRPAEEEARDRVLGDEELKQVWKACDELPHPYDKIIRLLVLTGARRREISEMEWPELDLEAGTWTLPAARAKNNCAHKLPLPLQAVATLKGMPRLLGSKFVFTNEGVVPVNNFATVRRIFTGLLSADMPRWTLHDLRRTTASGLARLGQPIHVVEKILNHRSGSLSGVAGIYNRHSYEPEMKAALQQWADHIDKLTGGNVIVLPTRV